MADDAALEAAVTATIDTLGQVIKRPPLTQKLLKKPPFRFLHDVVTNVIKASGFLEGLYAGDEKVEQCTLLLFKSCDYMRC